jgi:LacI family transcriptional regulator
MNVQQGMLEALHGTEFEMVVRPVDRGSATMLEDLRHFLERQRLFGVLLMPPISENDLVAQTCTEIGCRYVRMGSADLDSEDRMVASNDREAVREAVGFLVEAGHRCIGLVEGPKGFRSAHERLLGFKDALQGAGMSFAESLVAQGDYTFDSGVKAAEKLLDHAPRPTAIFASNDEMAAGVLHAARQRGMEVPRDLSIIGFDDTPIAGHIWPPLTTVRWPIATMARAAAHKLVSGDERADEGQSLFLSTLIRRASVTAPNAR